MRIFQFREIEQAYDHAASGGQALHLHKVIVDYDKAPSCFVAAVARGEDIAHLFDQDAKRLYQTAKTLGVRIIVIEHRGRRGQHVDLCGAPLRRAIERAERDTVKEAKQAEAARKDAARQANEDRQMKMF